MRMRVVMAARVRSYWGVEYAESGTGGLVLKGGHHVSEFEGTGE